MGAANAASPIPFQQKGLRPSSLFSTINPRITRRLLQVEVTSADKTATKGNKG
jgi:hypothetical protein